MERKGDYVELSPLELRASQRHDELVERGHSTLVSAEQVAQEFPHLSDEFVAWLIRSRAGTGRP